MLFSPKKVQIESRPPRAREKVCSKIFFLFSFSYKKTRAKTARLRGIRSNPLRRSSLYKRRERRRGRGAHCTAQEQQPPPPLLSLSSPPPPPPLPPFPPPPLPFPPPPLLSPFLRTTTCSVGGGGGCRWGGALPSLAAGEEEVSGGGPGSAAPLRTSDGGGGEPSSSFPPLVDAPSTGKRVSSSEQNLPREMSLTSSGVAGVSAASGPSVEVEDFFSTRSM